MLVGCNHILPGRILRCVVIGLRGNVRDVDCDKRVSKARPGRVIYVYLAPRHGPFQLTSVILLSGSKSVT
jgi:hypothetical protein